MQYAILIYAEPGVFERLSTAEQEAAMEKHRAVQREYGAQQTLGPVVRLMEPTDAVTVKQKGASKIVLDGPYAETKEHLFGIYVIDCKTIEDAIAAAGKLPQEVASYEIRPIMWSNFGAESGADA